ncbi:PopZ family protein [Rhizobiaceae sp. 2RAB30]
MAQASSAQREPSMEEILASIRRIIEDSDQGRKPHDVDVQARFDAPVERSEGSVIEVDAFRAELRGRIDRDHIPVQPEASAEDEQDKPRLEIAAPAAPVSEVQSSFAADVSEQPLADEPRRSREQVQDEVQAALDGVLADAMAQAEEVTAQPQQVAAEPSAQLAPRPAIISEQAGRQVAAAFGELSEAFAASRRKSFDEMAEEMLRPMLQDWLDNNLPTLVERLVREEIERVARGG